MRAIRPAEIAGKACRCREREYMMLKSTGTLFLLLCALPAFFAACAEEPVYTISGRVSGSWLCVDGASTAQPTTITLNPPGWTRTFTRAGPEFSFDNVREGDYALEVNCMAFGGAFPPTPMPISVSGADLTADVVLPFPHLPRLMPVLKLDGHEGRIRSLAYSPDGTELVSASDDRAVIRWNTADGERISVWRHEHGDRLLPLSLSPDGALLAAAAADGAVRIWDGVQGNLLQLLPGAGIGAGELTISPDGRILAAWSYGDGAVALWDVRSGEHLRSVDVLDGEELRWPSKSVLFLPGGEFLVSPVSNGDDLTISIWDVARGSLSKSTKLSSTQLRMPVGISSAAVSADGTQYALGLSGIDGRGGFLIWDMIEKRNFVRDFPRRLTHVDYSTDGKFVATASGDNIVVLWDANTGEPRAILVSDLEHIGTFAWSPTGRRLAAAGDQDTIAIWEMGSS
jgi:WD40 repeat protein